LALPSGSGRGQRRGESLLRYGVIADVHANVQALDAAVSALRRIGVDAFACAGDLVGYGPQPNECVEAVRALDAVTVAGNHDLIALGALSEDRCERLARESLRWTRAALDATTRDYLARLPRRAELPGGVVLAHGSLEDPQEYVLSVHDAAGQLARLAEADPEAQLLVVGHTHRPLACDEYAAAPRLGRRARIALDGGRRWLLNPGAVGQSREARLRARFMLLDLDRREVTFHAVRYDVRRTRALLREAGLPARSVHLAPWRPKAFLRPAIRAGRRWQAGVRGG
jgi:predicted phosphodiesterase